MSIGKSSIARAASNANTQSHNKSEKSNCSTVAKFNIDKIGVLSIAETPSDNDCLKLKESIKKRGIICPVLVAITPKEDVWLIDGYRRFYTAKELGITDIDAVVITVKSKTEANSLYKEMCLSTSHKNGDSIHQEKFNVLAVKDHDLPAYLL